MLAEIGRDLLGDLVVRICHGGIGNNRGAIRSIPVADELDGWAVIADIHKRRLRHGYRLVAS